MILATTNGEPLEDNDLVSEIAHAGIVFFRETSEGELLRALGQFAMPYPHPHDIWPGITLIAPKEQSNAAELKGFTSEGLSLHTDRSLEWPPPTLLATLMLSPATSGGESMFADARQVLSILARQGVHLPSLQHLSIVSVDNRVPVISQAREYLTVRYRDDAVAAPVDNSDRGILEVFKWALRQAEFLKEFGAGEGYIIHNHRVLHGRNAFAGGRSAVRMLSTIRTESPYHWLDNGFKLDSQKSVL
jgi:alpha-ketoglutarate-dependent taurine dioxygenase